MFKDGQPSGAGWDGFPGFLVLFLYEVELLAKTLDGIEDHPHPFVQKVVRPLLTRVLKWRKEHGTTDRH